MIVSPRLLRHGRRRFFRRFVFPDALAGLLLVAPSAGGVLGDSTPPTVAPAGAGCWVPGPRVLISNCGERGSTTGAATCYDQAFIAGTCRRESSGSQPAASGASVDSTFVVTR